LDIDVLCTVSSRERRSGAFCTPPAKIENLIGLVNRIGVSIHHVVKCARFSKVAFIFGERSERMVNRWYARAAHAW
jgi:hypothetical protein